MSRSLTAAALGSAAFFLAAPGVVAGFVPWLLCGWQFPAPLPLAGVPAALGGVLIVGGLAVLVDCFVRFARSLGTPAPLAPTERLVVTGAYRFVRNPIYVAVEAIILGQALLFWNAAVLVYAAVPALVVHLFVVGYEEPTLRQQFPDDYPLYAANVRRWLPRLTPWNPPAVLTR